MNARIVLLVVALAGLAGAGGYYLYAQRETPTATASTATPPEQATDSPPPLTLAATVPHFQLADREGQFRSLHDWQGKSLIVNFWATWCAPCRREIPLLQQIARERGKDGFQVIGIAVDFRDKVIEYADQMNIQYPLLIGEQDALDAAAAFGVGVVGFPFTIFTDARGRVILLHLGELTASQAELVLGVVEEVNAGGLEPAAARTRLEALLDPAAQHGSAAKSAG
jgi:thiol-disulfide isomerase/thioredoxin